MSTSNASGPVASDGGFEIKQTQPTTFSSLGTAGSYAQVNVVTTGIADTVATRVARITIPNANNSAVIRVLARVTLTAASHIADSTRVVEYLFVVTRLAGAIAAAAVGAAVGAQIATKASGHTMTATLGLSSITGGATATNTFDIQLTSTSTPSGDTAECQLFCEVLNYQGAVGNYVNAPATTGVTVSA